MALLPIVLLGALVALIVVSLGAGRRARRAVRPIRDPCCPTCRYGLRGVPAATCPECGHDLERGGVIDVRDPRRGLMAAVRTCALVPVALISVVVVAVLLDAARPRTWTWTTQATLRDMDPAAPPTSERVVLERTRVLVARTQPGRAAFPPGRVRMILPGRADRVLLDRPEAEVRTRSDTDLADILVTRMDEAGVDGPVALSVAILRDLAEGRFSPDPTRTFGSITSIRDAMASGDMVQVLGTRDDVIWRKSVATWPRTAGFVVAAGVLLGGGWLIVREYRRGDPVPWSIAGDPRPPREHESVS